MLASLHQRPYRIAGFRSNHFVWQIPNPSVRGSSLKQGSLLEEGGGGR